MHPVIYSLQFRGQGEEVGPGVYSVRAVSPSSRLVTRVDQSGVETGFESIDGGEVLLESSVREIEGGGFVEEGTIDFGDGHSLRFHTVGTRETADSPDPHLKLGTVRWIVDGGTGQFEGAQGRITSNLILSDTLELTDNQLGVIFVNDNGKRR